MAENLNYNASGSKCGNGTTLSDANTTTCDTYGRLYNWNTAMGGAASSIANPSGVQGVCPSGWHLPSNAEWDALMAASGGQATAGVYLKAKSGWNNNGNGLDTYGFSALPGGYGNSSTVYRTVGDSTFLFSASEYNNISAYFWKIDHYHNHAIIDNVFGQSDWNIKPRFFSVRCVRD
jgi:uncharacterized protein (TIGR02145 family)